MKTNFPQLMLGDCRSHLASIEDKTADLILIDPPYGVTNNQWDSVGDVKSLVLELIRVAKDDAPILIFAAHTYIGSLLMVEQLRKRFKYKYVWVKNRGTNFLNARRAPMRTHEDVLVFSSRGKKIHFNPLKTEPRHAPKLTNTHSLKGITTNYGAHKTMDHYVDDGSRYTTDVLSYPVERGLHPTQKPVALLRHLIKAHSPLGGVVLDCFAGSGSTAIAAMQEGRQSIMIERDPEYFGVMSRRVEEETTNQ